MKKNLLLVLGGIVLFVFIVLSSFMWYRIFYGVKGTTPVSVLQVSLDKENNTINETNALPISIEEVQAVIPPYEFSVNNTSKKSSAYKILLEEPAISDNQAYQPQNLLTRTQLGYQLVLNGKVIKSGMLSEIKNNILDERTIDKNSINRYQLRVFVSESAVNTSWQNKYYHYKVNIQTEEI